jgi:hypothetical protein
MIIEAKGSEILMVIDEAFSHLKSWAFQTLEGAQRN